MAYIITGATGHIGNNLVKKLVELKKEVKVLVRKIDQSINNLPIEYIVGNIFDQEFLNKNISSDDIVIHLAGIIDIKNKNKEQVFKINYEGANLITNICLQKNVKKYIYCSSVDAIEMTKGSLVKEPENINVENVKGNYGKSKALATLYVKKIMKENPDFNASIVYPSAVIGPNDWKPSAIGKMVQDSIDKKMQFGIKGGYNFVDVDDVVNAIIILSESDFKDDYILSGEIVSVYKMYQLTNKAIGVKRKVPRLPMFLVWLGIPFVPYLSPIVFELLKTNPEYDCSKAIRDLNYQHTPFEKTIEKTVNWFKNKK